MIIMITIIKKKFKNNHKMMTRSKRKLDNLKNDDIEVINSTNKSNKKKLKKILFF